MNGGEGGGVTTSGAIGAHMSVPEPARQRRKALSGLKQKRGTLNPSKHSSLRQPGQDTPPPTPTIHRVKVRRGLRNGLLPAGPSGMEARK